MYIWETQHKYKTASWQKRERIYRQRGDRKEGKQGTSKDATEGLWYQEIERYEGCNKYNNGILNKG